MSKGKEKIIEVSAPMELASSFLEYSMSVVFSRAIPSIDGFKPVQRRIIYGMGEAGWTHDKNFVKVSRVAGQVMGLYHPHGDSSISDALVKLAQPFYSKVPFIDPFGNFGDVTGSSAAASRYIESKLSKAAEFVLRDINEDGVDMKPNYDGTLEEPMLLPVMFPVLLVNGNFGIGVGFSNKIPSHNLAEVVEGTKLLLRKPGASLDEVMKCIPGPDFPTGAEIVGMDAVRQAYETGQGVIRIRAKSEIRQLPRGRHEIVFTEIPYGVKTETVIERIKVAIGEGKLVGLADAKDLTGKAHPLRLVVETKAGVNPRVLLAELLSVTPLEDSFGINSTVLVDGEPRTVGLIEMLQLFIDFRKEVVRRRSAFRRAKRLDRLHILDGMLRVLANIDAVIRIVRGAEDVSVARVGLMGEFGLDEVQADYVLAIALRRLTKFDVLQVEAERERLVAEVAELDEILGSEDVLRRVILRELDEVKRVLGEPRRSVLVGGSLAEHVEESRSVVLEAAAGSAVEDGPCLVSLLASGRVVRSVEPLSVGGRGKLDPVVDVVDSSVQGSVVLVTNFGVGHRVQCAHVSVGSKVGAKDLGITLRRGERFVAIARSEAREGEAGLALGTRFGVVKVSVTDFPARSDEFPVIALEKGDEVVGGRWLVNAGESDFVFVSSDSSLLRFEASKVRPQGSKGGGVAGVKLAAGAHVVGFGVVIGAERDSASFVTFTGSSIKQSLLSLVPYKGRATGGVRSHAFRKGEDHLEFAAVSNDLVVVDDAGRAVDLPEFVKRDASGSVTSAVPVAWGRMS